MVASFFAAVYFTCVNGSVRTRAVRIKLSAMKSYAAVDTCTHSKYHC